MSWNFFDAWKIKRTNEKQFKCTEKEFSDQEKKCKKKFNVWENCTENSGFNDPICRNNKLVKYYSCVEKLNRMKTFLEDKDLHKDN